MMLHTDSQIYAEVPRSVRWHLTVGLVLMALAFGGFGTWALRAPLAAAVMSPGTFVATGKNKIVQHLEGGIIHEILVSEGDSVTEGQVLLRLDGTAAQANQRELELRRARLEAIGARLRAEYDLADQPVFSDWLNQQSDDPSFSAIMNEQMGAFRTARAKLDGEIGLLESNIAAGRSRIEGFQQELEAVRIQADLLREDHATREQLFSRGLVRRSDVNTLARAIADADGQIGRLHSEIAETEEAIRKAEREISQTRNQHMQTAMDESQSIKADLDSVREQSMKARDILERSEILSPVSGTIVRLYYHTARGVIEAGKPIAEILPLDAPLVIESQISRVDIDDVEVGQHASVRLTALNQRTTPVLQGTLTYVSADALATETDGVRHEIYLAHVSLPASELERVPGFHPTPGMPAEVMIETAARTFFEYLVKPIEDSLSRAFREN